MLWATLLVRKSVSCGTPGCPEWPRWLPPLWHTFRRNLDVDGPSNYCPDTLDEPVVDGGLADGDTADAFQPLGSCAKSKLDVLLLPRYTDLNTWNMTTFVHVPVG